MPDINLTVLTRSGNELARLTLPCTATTDEVKQQLAQVHPRYRDVNRHYLTKGLGAETRTVLAPGIKLSDLNIMSGDSLYFKDLGPQICWKTVFHVEYAGPLIIHLLFLFMSEHIYKLAGFKPAEIATYKHPPFFNLTQQLCLIAVVFHYLKRELETHFVHRFSNATMPAFNIFKNSFHYWVLCGLNIAYFLYHPQFTAPWQNHPSVLYALLAAFIVCEIANLYCHLILRSLRPAGSRVRRIPRGFLFNYVSCGNYTAELAAWLCFCLMCNCLTAWLFLVVSTGQIAIWAAKKHRAYKKEFGKEYPRRNILFPFLW